MALRENERRILAEIEHYLSADDPELAGQLTSFGADDPSLGQEDSGLGGGGWKPWALCGLIATMVISMLVVLFTVTPQSSDVPPPEPAGSEEVIVPESEPANAP